MEIFSDDNKSNEFARTKTNLAIELLFKKWQLLSS